MRRYGLRFSGNSNETTRRSRILDLMGRVRQSSSSAVGMEKKASEPSESSKTPDDSTTDSQKSTENQTSEKKV